VPLNSTLSEPHVSGGLHTVAVFDLDGTLTRYDTYRRFLLSCLLRRPSRLLRAALLPIDIVRFKLRLHDNAWLKARFLRAVLGGAEESELRPVVAAFVDRTLARGMRQGALDALERHRAAGDRLILLSASPEIYVHEIASRLGFTECLSTHCERDALDRLTGRLAGANCYGAEKCRRLEGTLGPTRAISRVIAYTDHESDLPLLTWADEAVLVNPSRKARRALAGYPVKVVSW
jgi:phosphatidylglycerophosphatase C